MQKLILKIPTGGSLKGSTLEHAPFGLRLLTPARLTAAQLTSAQVAIKRRIKQVKGAECYLRVFPDIAVCVKGNETRMGKGKGSFEYWACRVPVGRVVFEVGGGGIREEIARQGEYLFSLVFKSEGGGGEPTSDEATPFAGLYVLYFIGQKLIFSPSLGSS